MDNYLTNPGEHTPSSYINGLLLGLGLFVGVAMVSRLAKNLQDYFTNVMSQKIGTDIYQTTIAHTFSLPYADFEDQQSGQLLQKLIKAKESIQTYIVWLIGVVFVALVWIAVVLWYSFYVDRRVGTLYLLIMPIVAWTTMSLSKQIKKAQVSISKQSNTLAGTIVESLRNVSLIKMLGLMWQEIKRIEKSNDKILTLELEKVKKVRTMEFLQGTLINAMRVTLIGYLGYLVFEWSLSVGELMSLYFYSFFLFGQISRFGEVVKSYQEAKANDEIIQDILMKIPEAPDDHLMKISHVKTVELQQISFAYHDHKDIIENFSADWKSGQTIAFVWPSGSGKSTLLKLICWLYFPSSWQILINGKPTTELNLTDLKQQIGIVSQDAQLFSGTIRDNLLFVAPDASDDDILAVIQQASLQNFLEEQEHGLDTMIGEWGVKLSGGQKQRLAIARALLRKPQLLIFDEATSALDSLVEKEIADTIREISQSRPDLMTVIVAHRLSTVMHADKIYVLERWVLVESGNHAHLLDQHWLYSAMWRQQVWEK